MIEECIYEGDYPEDDIDDDDEHTGLNIDPPSHLPSDSLFKKYSIRLNILHDDDGPNTIQYIVYQDYNSLKISFEKFFKTNPDVEISSRIVVSSTIAEENRGEINRTTKKNYYCDTDINFTEGCIFKPIRNNDPHFSVKIEILEFNVRKLSQSEMKMLSFYQKLRDMTPWYETPSNVLEKCTSLFKQEVYKEKKEMERVISKLNVNASAVSHSSELLRLIPNTDYLYIPLFKKLRELNDRTRKIYPLFILKKIIREAVIRKY